MVACRKDRFYIPPPSAQLQGYRKMCDIACVCISQGYWKQHIQFENKANRKMGEEGTKNKTTNYCPSLQERRRGREGGEKKRSGKGGRQEEETRDGGNTKQREKFEGWRKVVYIYILHTYHGQPTCHCGEQLCLSNHSSLSLAVSPVRLFQYG